MYFLQHAHSRYQELEHVCGTKRCFDVDFHFCDQGIDNCGEFQCRSFVLFVPVCAVEELKLRENCYCMSELCVEAVWHCDEALGWLAKESLEDLGSGEAGVVKVQTRCVISSVVCRGEVVEERDFIEPDLKRVIVDKEIRCLQSQLWCILSSEL
jgi:hypothetical protein